MINNSLQGSLQEAIRSALGCANTFEGDLHALCDLYGVASGHQDARLIGAAQKHDSTISTASGALNYFLLNPSVLPTFGLNFVDGTDTLDSRVTFTRASSGTRFNSSGTLVTMASNQPRFDCDPVTLAIRGLLIEEQRTNLLLQSAAFDNASWTKTNATVTANNVNAPDGATTAEMITDSADGAATSHSVNQSINFTSGTAYTLSVFAKQGTLAGSVLLFPSAAFTSNITARFDLSAGTVAATDAGVAATISAVGNGWYRCTATATATATAAGLLQIRTATAASSFYQGAGAGAIYIWGAQLEAGSSARTYIPTTTASATRAVDSAQFTIPSGVVRLTYTFDDNSTQNVAVTAGSYTIPTTLNRQRIRTIAGWTT